MFKVKVIDSIGLPPTEISGRAVLIEDQHGNPLAAVQSLADNGYSMGTLNDGEDFHALLRSMGMDKVVIVTPLKAPKPPEGSVPFDPSRLNEVVP